MRESLRDLSGQSCCGGLQSGLECGPQGQVRAPSYLPCRRRLDGGELSVGPVVPHHTLTTSTIGSRHEPARAG
jgi:hypothetical protein